MTKAERETILMGLQAARQLVHLDLARARRRLDEPDVDLTAVVLELLQIVAELHGQTTLLMDGLDRLGQQVQDSLQPVQPSGGVPHVGIKRRCV